MKPARSPLHRAAALATRRPGLVLSLCALLAVAGLAFAVRLKPDASVDTLIGTKAEAYPATQTLRERFGDDAIIVLVRGDLQKLLLSQDVERLLGLEGCIAGTVPPEQAPGGPGGPCAQLARTRPAKVVFGPGTFVNTAVGELRTGYEQRVARNRADAAAAAASARRAARRKGLGRAAVERAGALARADAEGRFTQELVELATRYGLLSVPRLDDPNFVSTLVFDSTKRPGTPKRKFAYLFPTNPSKRDEPGRTALVQVRLKAGLREAQRTEAIGLVRAAVAMGDFKPRNGATYTVTGAPIVVADLTESISSSMRVLLVVALLVMAAMLALVFRSRLRLLPLAIALAAAAVTFGALSLAGASLTMASIAVLPVLIGLAVDYAIQLQSRVREEQRGAGSASSAARRAALLGAPAVAVAAAATAAGFAVLAFSPVPMVRGFGLLLVAGIVIAFALALLGGSAALVLAERAAPPPWLARLAARMRRRGRSGAVRHGARETAAGHGGAPASTAAPGQGAARASTAAPGQGAARASTAAPGQGAARASTAAPGQGAARDRPLGIGHGAALLRADAARGLRRAGSSALAYAVARPARVLTIALALAACGWLLDTQTRVESDIQRLVPQDMPALRDLDALQRSTGVGGEIDVVIEGADLTSPRVISWMVDYQSAVLKEHGFSAARGCGQAELCPAFSLPDLFTTADSRNDKDAVEALLDAVPPYFSSSVITEDRRTATLAFGIRLMDLGKQRAVIDAMRARLDDGRPSGVRAAVAGLPVLAADANAAVSSSARRMLTLLAGLIAVALVLLVAFRDLRRALVPLVPIVLATGWSALVLFALRVPLNPMSVTLGALVIAISTEFSVLLSERYREERGRGLAPREALARTYASTGAAVLASGATAIAGFAVLVVSDIRMLRDFGFVTVIDLTVSLLGVLVVLPAVLLLAERRSQPAGAGPAAGRRRRRRALA